ncbi:MAG: DUF4112 domain-containing protein [Patescibacteria group bacterium]
MEKELKQAQFIATLLDSRFEIFGIRFGLNTLLEFIPGLGDVASGLLSTYIIGIGYRMNVPYSLLVRMIGNVLVAFIAGLVPYAGDTFYLFYKPNIRNVAILNTYVASQSQDAKFTKTIPDLPEV